MKVLVNISIPAISEQYDVLIPKSLAIREIIPLIVNAVYELSGHRYVSSGCELICHKEQKKLLNTDSTLEMYGVKNGDHLVFM